MILADIGNSMIKVAERQGTEWHTLFREPTAERERFLEWVDSLKEGMMTVCSVDRETSDLLGDLRPEIGLHLIGYRDIPAEMIGYDTPGTLGLDRFFVCYGARQTVPGTVVVIDAGTACTVDVMDAGDTFRGGVIMPGPELLRRVFRSAIPGFGNPKESLPERWPGRSSEESLRWGTSGVFVEALAGFLERYRREYGDYSLFLTGGESGRVARLIGGEVSFRERPWLLFEGMEAARRRFGW